MPNVSPPEPPVAPDPPQAPTASTDQAEAERLVSEVLSQLVEGVATLAADGTVVSWNARAERLTGYTLAQINTVGLVSIFEPRDVLHHLVDEARDGVITLEERLHLRRRDGSLVRVQVQCCPLRHLQGLEGQVVVIMREIAPLQAHLRRDARLTLLGRLAGSLSHEIRNPLNAVFLHVDILDEELRQPTPAHRAQLEASLHTIKTELARLQELVHDYLSLARLAEVRREPTDLGAVLTAMAEELQDALTAQGITLHLEGVAVVGPVALHPSTFRRALRNLIQNAMEAMPQGGTLTLRSERTASQVRLAIQDTGVGIPADQLPLLFVPFHTTKAEGTGLGLYVVQEIVAAHGGTVAVASAPGHGTTVTITLPRTAPDDTTAC